MDKEFVHRFETLSVPEWRSQCLSLTCQQLVALLWKLQSVYGTLSFTAFFRMVRDFNLGTSGINKTMFLMDCIYLEKLGIVFLLRSIPGYRFDTYALHQFVGWSLKTNYQGLFQDTTRSLERDFTYTVSSYKKEPTSSMVLSVSRLAPVAANKVSDTSNGVVQEDKDDDDADGEEDIFGLVAKESDRPLAENTQHKSISRIKSDPKAASSLEDSEWIDRTPSLLSEDEDRDAQAERM